MQYQKASAWVPFTAHYLVVCLTFFVPVVAIIALEVLFRISYKSDGVLDIYGREQMATYLSRYLSSSIVLSIATLFNSLDFTIACFAPYSLLRSEAVSGGRSLSFNLLGKLGPVDLWSSIEAQHVSSAFSNSAGILGSALTIVSSGLWVVNRTVVTDFATTASLADTWDVSWHNSSGSGDGGASISFDTFQHGGTGLPPSSWHDIVFPNITDIRLSPGVDASGDSRTQNITIQLEGLRPHLDCQVIADEYLDIDFSDVERKQITIFAYPPLPFGCQPAGGNGTSAHYNFSRKMPLDARYMGSWSDLNIEWWTENLQQNHDERGYGRFFVTNDHAGCPSIGVLFAKNHATNTSYDDVSALMCSQKIEKVKLNVTYLAHDMMHPSINTNIEPVVIVGPAEYMTNGTPGIDSFPYRVGIYFQKLTFFTTDDHSALDEIMNSMTNGPNRTSLEDLGGKGNRGRLTEAVGNFYTRYMTFVIDQRFRQPISQNSTNATNRLTGSTYRYTSRLQMNFASKLALQIMLATMTILGASALWLTDLRGTLPRKPTTIAGQLALFAGSDMCDEKKPLFPRDALWKSGKELDKVFDGWLFSLGWWPKTRKSDGGASEGAVEMSVDALLERKEVEGRRFGIDVGGAEQLGFR